MGIENPSLRNLPGFPPPYLKFVEDLTAPGFLSTDSPQKELLLSRCRAALSQMSPAAIVCKAIRESTTSFSGSQEWSGNIAGLESCSAAVVGVSADIGAFGDSLVPLLKCLTAIKLACEVRHEGIPAVPVLWLDVPARTGTCHPTTGNRVEVCTGSEMPARQHATLIDYFNKIVKLPLNIELYRDVYDRIMTPLVDGFGLILIVPEAIGPRLMEARDLADLRRKAVRLSEPELGGRSGSDVSASDSGAAGPEKQTLDLALLLRLAMPVGAEVVADVDLARATVLGDLVLAAGRVRPFLWPRISATVVDKRSARIMNKYKLRLPDVFEGSAGLLRSLENGGGPAAVSDRLEAFGGTIQARVAEICSRISGDSRTVRRIQASGSRVVYQVRKVAASARLSADRRSEIAVRQFARLSSQVAPGGELQEKRMSATQFVSGHTQSALSALYRELDVWDLKHQLIGLD